MLVKKKLVKRISSLPDSVKFDWAMFSYTDHLILFRNGEDIFQAVFRKNSFKMSVLYWRVYVSFIPRKKII